MIKAVFCDLDGTLLHGECEMRVSHTSIPVINKIELEKLIEEGIKFIPSSGRSSWDIKSIVTDYECPYVISNNGAVVHKKDDILLNNIIDTQMAVKLYHDLVSKNMTFMINTLDETFYVNSNLLTPARYEYITTNFDIKPFDEAMLLTDDFTSFCAITNLNYADLHQLELELLDTIGTNFSLLPSGMDCIDISLKGVHKGSGAQYVMNVEHWNWDEVACIGDNLNDVDMLKHTPHSFAMKHGRTKTKECSKHVVSSASEAFKTIIEYNNSQRK